ncbi:MAG: hypothetical protein ACR2JN_12375 [Lapillicoccus sp.]
MEGVAGLGEADVPVGAKGGGWTPVVAKPLAPVRALDEVLNGTPLVPGRLVPT